MSSGLPMGTGITCCACRKEISYGETYQTGAFGTFHSLGCSPPEDPVNPSHYVSQGQYSALHVVQKWGLGFCLGNALKYISRVGKEPGESEITDLKKAVWYIRRHIHELDPKEPDPAAPENRP